MAIISDEPGPHVINGTDYSDTIEANDGNPVTTRVTVPPVPTRPDVTSHTT